MVVLCDLHGRTGGILVCPHLKDDFDEKRHPRPFSDIIYFYGYFAGHQDAPMQQGLRYCGECGEEYSLPKDGGTIPADENDNDAPLDIGKLVCGQCFRMSGEQEWPEIL